MNIASTLITGLFATVALAGPAQAQGPRRQLGAHVHGASKLNVAIEGQTVTMALASPGHDIVGFEYRAHTDKQKAAVDKATQTLRDPAKLFTLSPAAGCTVTAAASELKFEDAPAPAPGKAAAAAHAEFEGRYSLACTNTAAIADIEFPFFKLFPEAREVEVQVIGPAGQRRFEVKRARPRLSLRSLGS
ncbi:MAG: DUF2796 domain-containing protein [Gemmatimonadaceae bacterium]|nr:DUF2796 domain-containing protein [Acetobacteraceae bacterium]